MCANDKIYCTYSFHILIILLLLLQFTFNWQSDENNSVYTQNSALKITTAAMIHIEINALDRGGKTGPNRKLP